MPIGADSDTFVNRLRVVVARLEKGVPTLSGTAGKCKAEESAEFLRMQPRSELMR